MENINLELYKIFCSVAKNKNITKTSQELMISQPAITQTIKKLEDQIGYKLFFRTKRGMELTENGEELYKNIRPAVECLNTCKRELENYNNTELNLIRIGGGTTLLKHNVTQKIKLFKEKYPNIKIEIIHDISSTLFNMLENNTLDIVLYNMPHTLSGTLVGIPIETVNDSFIANSENFNYLKNRMIDKEEFNNLPFVLQKDVSSSRKYLNIICKNNKIILNDTYELASYGLVLDFVKAGLGIGFINKNHIEEELKNDSLFEVKTNFTIPERHVGVAISKKNQNNKIIKEFIESLKK